MEKNLHAIFIKYLGENKIEEGWYMDLFKEVKKFIEDNYIEIEDWRRKVREQNENNV